MLRGCSPWPCEREGRTPEVPTSIFRLHLRHGQGPAVLEKNMVKLAETQLTDPGGGLDLKGRGKRGTETSFEFGRERGGGGSGSGSSESIRVTGSTLEPSNPWSKSTSHGPMRTILFYMITVCTPISPQSPGSPG